ncbi:MAG: hypothetical protein R3F60_32240 [bacterium]
MGERVQRFGVDSAIPGKPPVELLPLDPDLSGKIDLGKAILLHLEENAD